MIQKTKLLLLLLLLLLVVVVVVIVLLMIFSCGKNKCESVPVAAGSVVSDRLQCMHPGPFGVLELFDLRGATCASVQSLQRSSPLGTLLQE